MSIYFVSIPALEEAMLRLWQLRSVLLLAVLAIICFMKLRRRKVYLVDYACYRPKPEHKMTREVFVDRTICIGSFTQENIDFQRKVIERSGLGAGETYTSEAILRKPAILCMEEAWQEAEMVLIGAIDDLLEKTGVKISDIGILVVNCSLFNPTPSLSSMIVNHYKLKDDIFSFNLSGMGCSASHISVDLANNLLQVHDNTYALVVSTENITLNWYRGNDRDMLLPNCLFRMGGAAMLLSNKPSDLPRSKYELLHLVRTNKAYEERSYKCVNQKDDETGNVGVVLSKELMSVAGDALRSNLTTLGPKVLPISEQAHYFIRLLAKRYFPTIGIKGYSPNFMLAFEHFCIHAGGRAVLDEIEKNLKLTQYLMEPSRMTLHKYGNVSSSSTWYEMAYIEAKGRMKKGDKVWQIGFGSGFKCNSIVWLALKTIDPAQEKISPWIG